MELVGLTLLYTGLLFNTKRSLRDRHIDYAKADSFSSFSIKNVAPSPQDLLDVRYFSSCLFLLRF